MGSAIVEGLLKKKLARADQIWVYDKMEGKAADFSSQWKTHVAQSASGLVAASELVLLAVKPQDWEELGKQIQSDLKAGHVLISILAGTPIAKIERFAGSKAKVVRAMPNLGARVGEAVTALTGSDATAVKLAASIFSGCGKTLRLDEKYFDLVTALSGSGPAYFFLMMEQLVNMAVAEGMSKKDAELLAVQTAVGAGQLASQAGQAPEELRKMVTSKGGTTEAALKVLEQKKFASIFQEALKAALQRGRELSR